MTTRLPDESGESGYGSWCEIESLDTELRTADDPIALFRRFLDSANANLNERFRNGVPAARLIAERSWLIDQLLMRAWRRFINDASERLSLIAVGGYGRSELMPGSDIDLMILLPEGIENQYNSRVESLLTFLWDIRLEVGHSVRTVEECVEQSRADITVATNLMEARLLAGARDLFEQMRVATGPANIWTDREFYEAKIAEQQTRYHKYHDTAYKLEPNVKESPGGLRDIQMIIWVASRHYGFACLEDLAEHDYLTSEEYEILVKGRDYLSEIRYTLHTLTGRGEDRLLFDYQRTLAEHAGFHDTPDELGVEAFMKKYYRTVMELSRLNEMLLALIYEKIFYPGSLVEPTPINKRFQSRHDFLEITHQHVFRNYPFALLEIFLVLIKNPNLKGVRADTIRSVRQHRHLIDDKFRNDIRSSSLFMEIIRQPRSVTRELRRMNIYGILAAYIPPFGKIIGLMQYDLFHIYTVDEHILFVVRNLRRFTVPEFSHELPLCSRIISTIPKPELLYLAGLFHDIAKGRGGDHSELGSTDAREFCARHGLGDYDIELVAWLVHNHLLMSTIAQREDISDPVVVNRFARHVCDPVRLDYLYLLTVGDIRGTNPELWTTWKDALLRQLYYNTRRALQRGLQDPMERAEHIRRVQTEARRLLASISPAIDQPDSAWEPLGEEYFLRHTSDQVAWHTRLLAEKDEATDCIVSINPVSERGSTEIFIYAAAADELFPLITAILDQLALNVVHAGIITSTDGHVLNTFHVLETSGQPVENEMRMEEIHNALMKKIGDEDRVQWHVSRRIPREYKHFPIKTHVGFKLDEHDQRTVMELITADHPGLLSQVGRAFNECKVRLLDAKIATLGARAEDVYYITDRKNRPLCEKEQFECLEQALHKYLGSPSGAGDSLFS